MKRVVAVLGILLFVSNGFWLFLFFDWGFQASDYERKIWERDETRQYLMVILFDLARKSTKQEILAPIKKKFTDLEIYEHNGCTWIGMLGLKFDADGRLILVSPAFLNGVEDPCSPGD